MEFSKFISDSLSYNGWTKDMPLLESQKEWYVFVYNKRRGKSSGYFAHTNSECEFVSIGWTKSQIYSILLVEENASSTLHLASPAGKDRILGEVWKVPTEKLLTLDSDEKNTFLTKRIMVPVICGAKGLFSCWMYMADSHFLLRGGIKTSVHTGCTYIGTEKFLEVH